MSGTAYPGAVGTLAQTTAGLLTGRTRGMIPFKQWTQGGGGSPQGIDNLGDTTLAGIRSADTEGDGIAGAVAAHPGAYDDQLGAGADWYDDVHIFPAVAIDFGNIITQAEDEYEIYNAYRETDIDLDVVDASPVQPGILTPEMAATFNIPAGTSALNSSTTGNGAGLGLGTFVKLKVVAETNGLPKFDGDITFTDTGNGETVTLGVSGSRIVLMPMEYEAPLRETLAFLTDIITALDGKEQRIALRKNPRQIFDVTYALDGNDRQRMQSLLMDWTGNVFGFPLWHEKLTLTTAVSAGATVYSVANTADIDLRVGGLAIAFTDSNVFDVLTIASFTATTITATDPSVNAYPAGTTIMPVRAATILNAVSSAREANELEYFRITFEVTDNDTGALSGSAAAYSTYNSRVLFDDCNVVEGQMTGEYRRRIYRIDNDTGKASRSTTWDRNKRSSDKGFVLRNRAEILAFRKAMLSINGRQTAFYIPTAIEDLTPVAQLTIGTNTMDIENIEYVRFVQSRAPKTIFKITFTDGTSLVRIVQSAAQVTSTVERLTLDTTWPATRSVAEIVRVQFYELARFDADNVVLNYPRIGLADAQLPVVQVFDDN